ncbi:YdaU family protein [Microvirga sp. Mcv34]|uniref:YdaU family protein n=1 Tax=Microvirga sp. Mcv34 TaxID=2926016 RepID=UPI0021C92CC8|nr:YdaU family protein [Microvirga sp. Mcv34]
MASNIPVSPPKIKPRGEAAWYPRRPRAFFNGCLGMSFEERAAYSTLLDLIYEHGGPIYYDLGHIASHMGTGFPTRKAAALIRRLEELGKIYRTDDGLVGNREADQALQEAAEKRAKAASDGAKGGRPSGPKSELSREEVEKKSPKTDGEDSDIVSTSSEDSGAEINNLSDLQKGFPFVAENPKREEENRKESKKERQDRISEEWFPRFWQSCAKRPGDSRKNAEKAFRKAIGDGHDPATIVEGAVRYKRRKGHEPEFIKGAAAWLNGEYWMGEFPEGLPKAIASDGSPQIFQGPNPAEILQKTPADWEKIQKVARGLLVWDCAKYGPPPWEKGCLIPEGSRTLERPPGGMRVINRISEIDDGQI